MRRIVMKAQDCTWVGLQNNEGTRFFLRCFSTRGADLVSSEIKAPGCRQKAPATLGYKTKSLMKRDPSTLRPRRIARDDDPDRIVISKLNKRACSRGIPGWRRRAE